MIARLLAWASRLKRQLLALWFCRTHPDTPFPAKLLAAVVVAYAFSPIDLIPDFIPILGMLDDVILLPLGVYLVIRLLPAHVLNDGKAKADAWIADKRKKPRSLVGATLIALIWLALASAFVFTAWTRWR